MKTLRDLLEHQLKDLYSAENQLIDFIPKMVSVAHDKKLKEAFESHLEETREHKTRIKEICKELEISPAGEKCNAMKGLIEEAENFLQEDAKDEVKDTGLIAQAQRIEHYEISGYGTAARYAKELGLHDITEILNETLDEEYNADERLTDMAEERLNKRAIS